MIANTPIDCPSVKVELTIDRSCVTFVKRLGAVETAHPREGFEAVIGLRSQMGAGPRRHAAGNTTPVNYRNLLPAAHEFIGRGKAGDPGTHHDRVDPLVVSQRGRVRNNRVYPE